jgi:glycerate 2-kinase
MEGAADNLPDDKAQAAAAEILALASEAEEGELTIFLVSGGGSSLLPVPAAGISLAEKLAATRGLARKGASIDELNTVRKHISAVKGGQLAAAASPSQVLTLLLSDVMGDPLDVIASGERKSVTCTVLLTSF